MKLQISTLAMSILIAAATPAGDLIPPGAPASTANLAEPRTPITALPVTLEESGSYYLTGNLVMSGEGNGIVLEADNIAIDLNGFSLIGDPLASDGSGIWHDGASGTISDITIRNGTIRDWATDGVDLGSNSDQTLVEDLHVSDCGGSGIRLHNISTVRDSTVESCGGSGIFVNLSSTVIGCSVHDNGENGIRTGVTSVVQSCSARGNGSEGILAIGSIVNCSAANNNLSGIYAGTSSVVSRCSLDGNHVGIRTSSQVEVLNCQISSSSMIGIDLGTRSTVRSCTVVTTNVISNIDGIIVGDNSLIIDNRVHGHVNSNGIRLDGNQNRVEGNVLMNNSVGLNITGTSSNNLVIRNSYVGNTTSYTVPLNPNTIGPPVNSGNIATNDSPHANYVH